MGGWTSKMRANRNSFSFNPRGEYRPNSKNTIHIEESKESKKISADTQSRQNILQEIETRCGQGENLDEVVAEIAGREEVKQQFDYYEKNGIADLSGIFKNWYQSYIKNQGRNNRVKLGGIR